MDLLSYKGFEVNVNFVLNGNLYTLTVAKMKLSIL